MSIYKSAIQTNQTQSVATYVAQEQGKSILQLKGCQAMMNANPRSSIAAQRQAMVDKAIAQRRQPMPSREHNVSLVGQLKRIIQNRSLTNRIGSSGPHSLPENILQRKNVLKLKDSGAAKRTDGSAQELREGVAMVILSRNTQDMKDTAEALRKSIQNRRDAPKIGAEPVPGGHDYRISLEEELLGEINDALARIQQRINEGLQASLKASLASGRGWGTPVQ